VAARPAPPRPEVGVSKANTYSLDDDPAPAGADARELALLAALDQARATIREQAQTIRDLEAENGELQRSNGPEAVRRALRALGDWQTDKSTAPAAPIALEIYLDQTAAPGRAKVWEYDAMEQALGRSTSTQRK